MPELVSYLAFDPAEYTHGATWRPIPPIRTVSSSSSVTTTTTRTSSRRWNCWQRRFRTNRLSPWEPGRRARLASRLLQSGALSEAEIHALYAGARLVVFPSFYEGFGFPIVTTLAYGGTLLARQSPLLEEIAARSFARGRVVPFTDRIELVELVGRLLHGEDVATLPVGTAVENGRPMSWQDVGAGFSRFSRV